MRMMRPLPVNCCVAVVALCTCVESFRSPTTANPRRQACGHRPLPPSTALRRAVSRAPRLARQQRSTDYDDEGATAGVRRQGDPLILRASDALRASSWFSWWSQVILTVISSVTFLFARNVMSSQAVGPADFGRVASKFFLPGLGIVASSASIMWTWGQRRLARRFVRRTDTSRVQAANLLRRVIKFGAALNLAGLLTSVLGAQYIVGTLAAKSMQGFVGLGGGAGGGGIVASQTLQPLDVLVVQANTNILSSHFISLACLLWLTRMVDLLDPPSLEDDGP